MATPGTAPTALIGHLGQVFDVDVQVARLVVLEGLFGCILALLLGLQISELGQAFTAQQTADARARCFGVDELPCDTDQVVQGQQAQAADLHDDQFLRRAQSGGQLMRPVRAVQVVAAISPFARRAPADVVGLGHLGEGCARFMNFSTRTWCGARHRMYHAHDLLSKLFDASRPAKTARARNNGQLRRGT